MWEQIEPFFRTLHPSIKTEIVNEADIQTQSQWLL